MNAPYSREVEYLSPTSLDLLENNPIRFYLERLGPIEHRPPKLAQTTAMAIGSWFDCLIKDHLARAKGWSFGLKTVLDRSVEAHHRDPMGEAALMGHYVFQAYLATPAIDRLLEEGLAQVELHPETRVVGTENLAGREVGGVPIGGRPDALIRQAGKTIVLDWKVNGAASQRGASPSPGYLRLYSKEGDEGPHIRSLEHLEDIDERWAKQIAMYGWQLGAEPGSPIVGALEQCAVGSPQPGGRIVRVAQFRLPISCRFQLSLLARIREAWARIKEHRVLPEGTSSDPRMLALLA